MADIKELFEALKTSSAERIKNPLIGSFLVFFILFNFDSMLILAFEDKPMSKRIEVAKGQIWGKEELAQANAKLNHFEKAVLSTQRCIKPLVYPSVWAFFSVLLLPWVARLGWLMQGSVYNKLKEDKLDSEIPVAQKEGLVTVTNLEGAIARLNERRYFSFIV